MLRRTNIDNRLASAVGGRPGIHVESGIATAVFYLILLFVLVAALQALNLTIVTGPLTGLLTIVLGFIPRLTIAPPTRARVPKLMPDPDRWAG